jgi:DNA ligase-1
MLKEYVTLYKKSKSTGKIQQWTVLVGGTINSATIECTHGGVGEKLTTDPETITKGKNIGKSNETTPWEQAVLEADAKFEKKLKSGYVKTLAAAKRGKVDAAVKGGIEPQLAHSYAKQGHKISFPCVGQPKLDGIRCIAIKLGTSVTLWSRQRNQFTSCPHIEEDIRKVFAGKDIILDGELYNHTMKHVLYLLLNKQRR